MQEGNICFAACRLLLTRYFSNDILGYSNMMMIKDTFQYRNHFYHQAVKKTLWLLD